MVEAQLFHALGFYFHHYLWTIFLLLVKSMPRRGDSSKMNETNLEPPSKKSRIDEPGSSKVESFTADVIETNDQEFVVEEMRYPEFVTPEEVARLHEFKVLDEVKSNDEDSNEGDSDSSDEKSEGVVPEEEIEKMLDEDLPEDFKGAPKPKEKPYITRQKTVLEEKGVNQFEVLPLDWMMVRHHSGMPVYIHRTTRVCTLAKPYFLGKGNTRRHDIPISAIPCLAYRKALEEEAKQQEIDRIIDEQIRDGSWVNNVQNNKSTNTNQTTQNENTPLAVTMEQTQPLEGKCPFKHNRKDNSDTDMEVNEIQKEINSDVDITSETQNIDGDSQATETKEVNDDPECAKTVEGNANNTNQAQEINSENGDTGVNTQEASGVNGGTGVPLSQQPVVLPGGIVMPPPRVETVNTSWKTQHLTHEQLNDYCKKLFKFKTVNIMHFKRWADRRKYTKARKTLQYPTLPEGTKLITIPAAAQDAAGGKAARRDWVMNMNGRSYLSVFHEYVCRALHKQPVYEFKQLENAATPYQATVHIGGMAYGAGRGASKRQAKAAAARASIAVLIPELADAAPADAAADCSFFDCVGIEDPRVDEFCAATCEPSPHAILRTCLLRNFGAGDTHIHTEMKKLEYQKIELTMRVGKHSATVVCKNKKTAKQRASQAILQALHPHVRSWGSLLRLYGSRSVKSCKEKKVEEQQITLLQDKARHNEPNYAVLEKLRHEMRKLKERDEAVVPIGTLLLPHCSLPHTATLNNVDI